MPWAVCQLIRMIWWMVGPVSRFITKTSAKSHTTTAHCHASSGERQNCMMLSNPYIYGISKPQCLSWEHHDKDSTLYWHYEGARKTHISGLLHQYDMLVGKVTINFYTVYPNDFSLVRGRSYESPVVDSSCEITWVSHDANSGQSIPSDAVLGGVLPTTNTTGWKRPNVLPAITTPLKPSRGSS